MPTTPPTPAQAASPCATSSRASGPLFVAHAVAAAFAVYFCMYAFRKPFDAITFTGLHIWGTRVELKTACVVGQILGYVVSKYLGTKVCSEVPLARVGVLLVGLILVAQAALVVFAVVPAPFKPVAMFVNGLPLGMVWGLVVRHLEGRRSTELLLAGLSCSFILAGAVTRDIGRDVVMREWGVPEVWMPAVTGGLFLVPLVVAVWALSRLPRPTAADVAARAPRSTMMRTERRAFLGRFGLGLGLMLAAYFFLTAFRDFRDHYSAELFVALGLADQRGIFSNVEQWALFGTIAAMAGLILITDHRRALVATFGVILVGFAIVLAATLAYEAGALSGYLWMVWVGVGVYLAYVPFGAVLFERMMAGSRLSGTSVFAIQLADGVGYTGSVLVQIYRDVAHGELDRLAFFVPYSYVVALVGLVLMAAGAALTLRRLSAPEA